MTRVYKILFGFILIGLCSAAFSQQRPINSLYMFDLALVNPAYVGSQVQFSATAIHRNQWVNFPGAPRTTTLSMHSGFLKTKIGFGLIVAHDNIGVHDDFSLYLQYSYKIKLEAGTLSMGLQAGFNNLKSDFSDLVLRNGLDPTLGGQRSKFSPNFGAGFFFHNEKIYLGLSAPTLINNKIVDFEGIVSEAKQTRNYFLQAGMRIHINENLLLLPSTLIRATEGAPLNADISATMVLHETVGLGLSLRTFDALVWMFELAINENFHLGYAYDITLTDLADYSNGTHEFMINYRIRIPKLHKGLECPAYF